ncbi:MAG: sulfatase-like hydrolase/transferase [Acidobacteria bacterium]|nr:sulfatase-like hydrolase/transferase [Acidobacteriota bacterium]
MLRRDFLALPLAAAAARRPNFVLILVDDLRFDELRCTGHPFAETPHADRIAREGAMFVNAFATTPLCSPSRASFLTGQYTRRHGIIDNTAREARSHQLLTWPRQLHDAGYETAFLGKWHMGNDDSPRPGFDRWVSFRGQGECFNPPLNIDGRNTPSNGYVTDILTDHAVEFLARKRDIPFCLYLAHKAVHPNIQQNNDGSVNVASINDAGTFLPAPRHRNLYGGKQPPHRPNYAVKPRSKPALELAPAGVEPLSATTVTDDATILNRLRMAKAVDESLGRILEALEQSGALNDTMVIFTSDHGYFYGEHCLGAERRLAYEEAIRIPLLVRYPPKIRQGTRPARMVSSIDIAATALELAGVTPKEPLDGRSMLTGAARREVYIEYFSDTVFPRIRKMGYQAVRTARWKYIRYAELSGADELYDLRTDPYELTNRIRDHGAWRAELRAKLDTWKR